MQAIMYEEINDEEAGPSHSKWNNKETLFFLTIVKKNIQRINDPLLKKKKLWTEMSAEMIESGVNMTPFQVSNKVKSLKRSYRDAIDHSKSGVDTKTCKYFDELEELWGDDTDFTIRTGSLCSLDSPSSSQKTDLSDTEESSASWDDEHMLLFLAVVKEFRNKIFNPIMKKDPTWKKICTELREIGVNITPSQAYSKLKTLETAYNEVVDRNKSGKCKITCKYFEELNELWGASETAKTNGSSVFKIEEHVHDTTVDVEDISPIEYLEIDPADVSEAVSSATKWTDKITVFFIQLIKQYFDEINNPAIPRNTLWKEMAVELSEVGVHVSPAQVENKIKSLKRSYRDVIEHNKAGVHRKTCKYYKQLEELWGPTYGVDSNLSLNASKQTPDKSVQASQEVIEDNSSIEYLDTDLTNTSATEWDDEQMLFFITVLKEYVTEINDPNNKKNELWRRISVKLRNSGLNATPNQVENKIKYLKTSYEEVLLDHGDYGNEEKTCKFFDELDELWGVVDDSQLNPTSPLSQDYSETTSQIMGENILFECIDMDPMDTTDGIPSITRWTKEKTLLFLTIVKKHFIAICDTNIQKKPLWKAMSDELMDCGLAVTPLQVENKLKSLKRSYKETVDHNKFRKYKDRRICKYYKELKELWGDEDDNIIRIENVCMSSNNVTEQTQEPLLSQLESESDSLHSPIPASKPKAKKRRKQDHGNENEAKKINIMAWLKSYEKDLKERDEKRIQLLQEIKDEMALHREQTAEIITDFKHFMHT